MPGGQAVHQGRAHHHRLGKPCKRTHTYIVSVRYEARNGHCPAPPALPCPALASHSTHNNNCGLLCFACAARARVHVYS